MGFNLKGWHIIAIILAALFLTGTITIDYLNPPTPPGTTPPETTPPAGLLIVSKTLKFVFLDKFAGAAPSGTGGYLYDSAGATQLEGASNAISSGAWTTSNSYASDTALLLKYVYDTSNDDVYFYPFTVPRMSSQDAQSLSTNTITVKVFALPTLTDALYDSGGNTHADAGVWNKTTGAAPGVSTATATYSWYVSADNKGYMTSYDPQYKVQLKPVIWVTMSGTGYENCILLGFDGAYQKGTTMYYYHVLTDVELTKYKVGNDYLYAGSGSFSWTVNLAGYSGTAVTMQIYLYVYSDPVYHQQFGSYGPYAVQLAEQTQTLTV